MFIYMSVAYIQRGNKILSLYLRQSKLLQISKAVKKTLKNKPLKQN